MKQLKIALCDDQREFLRDLRKTIFSIRPQYYIELFSSGNDLMASKTAFDLYILDLEMPEMSGMEIAEALRAKGFVGYILFLTNYTEMMQQAFKVRAYRFFTKPIEIKELEETFLAIEDEVFSEEKRFIDSLDIEQVVYLNDIVYITADKKHSIVTLQDGRYINAKASLKDWENDLPKSDFYRPHKSYIISFRHIKKLEEGVIYVKKPAVIINVGKKRYSELKEKFYMFINEHKRIM